MNSVITVNRMYFFDCPQKAIDKFAQLTSCGIVCKLRLAK